MSVLDKRTIGSVSDVISEIDRDEELSDDSETERKPVPISKEFQENVVKFVKLDDLIRKKRTELTELTDQKKPCEAYILKYLDDIGENVIDITNGKLRKNRSETKATLTQDVIKKALSEKILDGSVIEDIIKSMEEKRPTNTHVNIKRTGQRQKRIKKKESA
jgi:hypothetical protein